MIGKTNSIFVRKKSKYKTWTIQIDQSNSNPLTCCTYADDAIGMIKGSSDWDDIFGYKPCVLQRGVVTNYLDPNNFGKNVNGQYIGNPDSVMIEFPCMGINISTSGNIITVSLTNEPNKSGFQYRAFTNNKVIKNKLYLGAYLTSNATPEVCSITNATPATNVTITDAISKAQAKGSGYDIMGFYQWTYIQCLYLLKYGNLNSQAALGNGYVYGSGIQQTGATDTNGMCYGNLNNKTDRVKLFGLEDAWGNVYQWLGDVCYTGDWSGSGYNILTRTSNFTTNTSVSNYEFSTHSDAPDSTSGYITKVKGTNDGGFSMSALNSGYNGTTYFCDYGQLDGGGFPYVGGRWDSTFFGPDAGIFSCYVSFSASNSASNLGYRLQYL